MSTPTNENTGAEGVTQGSSFIDRMEAEYRELDAKLNKAVDFVKTETHAALHPDYQHLLQQQISGMSQYLHALAARLLHHGRGITAPTVAMEGGATTVGEPVSGAESTTSAQTTPQAAEVSATSAENHASS